jgi:RsiW-degrading membrane proteinase PrsW (M82 family)
LVDLILITILSLTPCALWLGYFSSQSRYKRPSRSLIALTFLLGAVATIPAAALNLAGQRLWLNYYGGRPGTSLVVFLLVVAPVEELLKLLAVYACAYRRPEFDEPLDGVIYSAAAALGFAAAENVVYLAQGSPLLVLVRGPLSNPGHALFSACWGLALSRAKAAPNLAGVRLRIIAGGWLLAVLLHGAFDLMLASAASYGAVFLGLLLVSMISLFFWVRSRIRFYRDSSPHREGTLLMASGAYCQQCGTRGLAGAHCSSCGELLPEVQDLALCPVCESPQRPGAKFCARCGANLRLPRAENLDARPHLVALTPAGKERIACILNRDEILVGRTLNNGFVVEHPSVSKRHARLVAEAAAFAVHDLGSANGTFINGRRIKTAQLEDGCEVRFGRASFVYRGAAGGQT